MVSRLRTLELRKTGQWEAALNSATADIEKDDGTYVNLMWRGLIYRQLGQIVLAIADFTQATRWETPETYYHRGNAYLAMARYEEAAADHRRYLELVTVRNNAELVHVKDLNRLQREDKKPDPINYPPLNVAFCLESDCKLSLDDCAMALTAGHQTALVYFCQGAAYEACRDYFQAIAAYQKIDPKDPICLEAQVAIERAHQAALYVTPNDKQLMRPSVEYLRLTSSVLDREHRYEYFDLNSSRTETMPFKGAGHVKLSADWKLVAERINREEHVRFYQRGGEPAANQRQGLWEMLKSKLSLN